MSEPRPKRPTMADIASQAGVSRTTVSLVLNEQDARIPDSTRELIKDVARRLNYRPSVAARELRTQRSSMVGLVSDVIASGAFGGGLIAGAQEAISAGGGVLLVLNTGHEGELQEAPVDELHSRGVTSLILATVMTRPLTVPTSFWEDELVLLNCFDPSSSASAVLPDDEEGGYQAARHLVELGHRKIAYVGGDPDSHPIRMRVRGAERALAEAGIDGFADVWAGGWHGDAGYDAGHSLLAEGFQITAVLCGNDRVAIGVLDAAKRLGIDVPGDVSVVGFDDEVELAQYSHPSLTTVRLPYTAMGRAAGDRLLAGDTSSGISYVACELVVRDSTAEPGRR